MTVNQGRAISMDATSQSVTTPQQAARAWQVLVGCAVRRQTLHYNDLAEQIGLSRRMGRLLGNCLDRVAAHCQRLGVPNLSVIVVRKGTGRPGAGQSMVSGKDLEPEREAVYRHKWHQIDPPSQVDMGT